MYIKQLSFDQSRVVVLGTQRCRRGELTEGRRLPEMVEMDACVSVYSGQSDRLDGRRVDVEAVIDLDAADDDDSFSDTDSVCPHATDVYQNDNFCLSC